MPPNLFGMRVWVLLGACCIQSMKFSGEVIIIRVILIHVHIINPWIIGHKFYWSSRYIFSVAQNDEKIKPNYFKKQYSSSSFLLTWSRYTGPNWPKSTSQPSSIYLRHGASLLRHPGHFGPVYLLQVSKNDDEEHCF